MTAAGSVGIVTGSGVIAAASAVPATASRAPRPAAKIDPVRPGSTATATTPAAGSPAASTERRVGPIAPAHPASASDGKKAPAAVASVPAATATAIQPVPTRGMVGASRALAGGRLIAPTTDRHVMSAATTTADKRPARETADFHGSRPRDRVALYSSHGPVSSR